MLVVNCATSFFSRNCARQTAITRAVSSSLASHIFCSSKAAVERVGTSGAALVDDEDVAVARMRARLGAMPG
jgi:hypothetical protein